VDFDPNYKGQI